MGKAVYNGYEITDYATQNNEVVFQLHMDLPISQEDGKQISEHFRNDDFQAVEKCLIAKYPQHEKVLKLWILGIKDRKENERPVHVVAQP